MPRAGVLLVGFGAPGSLDAVGPFMRSLTGRDMPDAALTRVKARYEAIGGASPLGRIAAELAEGISAALRESGCPLPVEVGMRYSEPLLEDAVGRLLGAGAEEIVIVALSPHVARVTHGEYRSAALSAVGDSAAVIEAHPLSALAAYARLHARAAAAALEAASSDPVVVFSAHSLPLADVAEGDSYVRGVEASASDVARALGLGAGVISEVLPGITAFGAQAEASTPAWLVAYQSEGIWGGEWLRPTLDDVLDAVAATGHDGAVVVPIGFATDHMETLYDLDIVARGRALGAGIAYVRSAVPNASPELARAIADDVCSLVG